MSFIALTIYVVLLLVLFTPGVMVNDDVAMMSFANGDFTGQHEFQLVFIGALVGGLLKTLYDLNSTTPWYAVFLVATQIFSGSVLISTVFKLSKFASNRGLVAITGLIALLTPVLVLDISFSTTAMYVSVVGLVSVAILLEAPKEFGLMPIILSVSTLVLGSSLRFDFLLAAGLLLLPIFFLQLRKLPKKVIFVAAAIFLAPFLTHVLENRVTHNDEWSYFHEFNEIRGSMHGTPALKKFVSTAYDDETISKIRAFGWESEDLHLFENWYFEDSERFNIETLRKLQRELDEGSGSLPFQDALENLILGREFLILVGSLIVALGSIIISSTQKKFLAIQVVWFFAIAIFISSTVRFPDRFALGALFGLQVCVVVSSLIFARRHESDANSFRLKLSKTEMLAVAVVALVSVFLIPHKFSGAEVSKRNEVESERLRFELTSLEHIVKDGVVVFVGAQLTIAGINPWNEHTLFADNKFLGLGWASQSPHQEQRKSTLELDGNLIGQLRDAPNKFLLTSQIMADLLHYSYERRVQSQITIVRVADLPFGSLYSVVSDNYE